MTTSRRFDFAVALLVSAVTLAITGLLMWNMTTAEQFGPPGHLTRTVQHQIYPHRAEVLWAMAVIFGAIGVLLATGRRRPLFHEPR